MTYIPRNPLYYHTPDEVCAVCGTCLVDGSLTGQRRPCPFEHPEDALDDGGDA
jgi:hypothetical protein